MVVGKADTGPGGSCAGERTQDSPMADSVQTLTDIKVIRSSVLVESRGKYGMELKLQWNNMGMEWWFSKVNKFICISGF